MAEKTSRSSYYVGKVNLTHTKIREGSEDEMENLVLYYYKTSWVFRDFLSKVKELENKLKLTQKYFPASSEKITSLLKAIETKTSSCRIMANLILFGQVILTFLSALAGGLAVKKFMLGAGLGGGLGMAGGVVGESIWRKGNIKKAVELVNVGSTVQINVDAFNDIAENEGPVLILLGSNAINFSVFANTLVQYINPKICLESQAFDSDKYMQFLSFNYPRQDRDKIILTRCHLVCLWMMDDPTSRYYNAMMKIAEMLIPAVSFACVMVESSVHYALPLLKILPLSIGTRIVVVSNGEDIQKEMRQEIKRLKGTIRTINGFTREEIISITPEIKISIDTSNVQPFSRFREEMNLLSEALKQISS